MMLERTGDVAVVHPLHGVDDFGDEFFVGAFEPHSVLAVNVYAIGVARWRYLDCIQDEVTA
ncbi:protein of unknown function [Pararobbsia alpina]|uniref:hypothetical protein n=1 Tax=Pararobbsia alpina TaxID=621374 RepID=UPI0039A71921